MAPAANKEKYSSINRIAIGERAFLEEADRPSPYPTIFISVTIFVWVLLHPILSNADQLKTCLQL